MKKILLVVPDLGFTYFARQLAIVLPRLPRDRFRLQVYSLGGSGPFARPLQDVGIPIFGHGGHRFFDLDDWLSLRNRVAESNPDAIHVFGLSALKTLRLACLGRYGKLKVISSPGVDVAGEVGLWARRLLRAVERVATANEWEAGRVESMGVDVSRVRLLPPAVEIAENSPDREGEGIGSLSFTPSLTVGAISLPADAKFILCVSNFESVPSPRAAVWDFDILRYVDPTLHLLMVGDGPARPQVEEFGRRIAREDHRVHYLGIRDDVRDLIRRASFVWIPNHRPGGTNVALEAMAAGVPVVATDLPNLRFLRLSVPPITFVPPAAPTALARATRQLMQNPEAAREQAETARAHVVANHDPARVVERWVNAYLDATQWGITETP